MRAKQDISGASSRTDEWNPGGDLGDFLGVTVLLGVEGGEGLVGDGWEGGGEHGSSVNVGDCRAPDEVQLLAHNWAAILLPAIHSVSRFFARSWITLAFKWKVPHMAPSTIHWTVVVTVPRILILCPAYTYFWHWRFFIFRPGNRPFNFALLGNAAEVLPL